MRKRNPLGPVLAVLVAASGLALATCKDYTTGQMEEPSGPLLVTRLTFFDSNRTPAFFADSSLPDCQKAENKDTPICFNDVNKDKYFLERNPPSMDSEIRVVFNKSPLLIYNGNNAQPLEDPGTDINNPVFKLTDPSAIDIKCVDATKCNVPPMRKGLDVTGSAITHDPTVVPYGPSLKLNVDTSSVKDRDHLLNALEPDTEYQVSVSQNLAGRDGQKLLSDASTARLLRSFKTESFRVLQAGVADPKSDATPDPMKPGNFTVAALPADGIFALLLDSPVDESVLNQAMVTATVGMTTIKVKLVVNPIIKGMCQPTYRYVYVYPEGKDWGGNKGDQVTVTIPMNSIRVASQAPGHPDGMGKEALADVVFTGTLTGAKADKTYTGITSDKVSATADCPGAMAQPDMGNSDAK